MSGVILPGATIGVLGSGQLGRMLAIAARRMGYRVHTFSPDEDTPTGQVSDRVVRAAYDDLDALCNFAAQVDVVTFEFENIPADAALAVNAIVPVRPSPQILFVTQHRLREKTYLSEHGFPVVPFAPVDSLANLEQAVQRIGAPAVLKTAGFGYDGKGQCKLAVAQDAERAWSSVAGSADGASTEAVLEAFIEFQCELSVIVARGLDGRSCDFGVLRNDHARHILDVTVSPAEIAPQIERQACQIARSVADQIELVGVLCVEFFLTADGRLLINELAPRPHNSGHLTFDACLTSQFEQQLRTVCGLPLGSTERVRPAAMANLLGDLWDNGTPDWQAALEFPEVKLHLYGKETARPGRKMGHLTALAPTAADARRIVLAARAALTARNRTSTATPSR